MNIEITDLDMILNYLETTSLEPHDDYSSEFTYKDQKILYKYIKQLQQENKQLKDNWDIIKQEILKIRQSTFSKYNSNEWNNCLSFNDDIEPILDKMQELEQGSDSNE